VKPVHVLPVEIVRHGHHHPVAVEVLSAHHSWFSSSLTLGDVIIGVCTLVLAGFTAWLGFSTRASAKATQAAVEASEEPFVLATPTDNLEAMILRPHERPQGGHIPPFAIHRASDVEGKGSFVRLKLWNIGHGPAIATAVQLLNHDDTNLLGELYQHYALPAGGPADIEIPSPRWVALPGKGRLVIHYAHANGRQYLTTSEVDIDDPLVHCKTYERTRPKAERPGSLTSRIKRLVTPGTQDSR
jgi:hypothetical protein